MCMIYRTDNKRERGIVISTYVFTKLWLVRLERVQKVIYYQVESINEYQLREKEIHAKWKTVRCIGLIFQGMHQEKRGLLRYRS